MNGPARDMAGGDQDEQVTNDEPRLPPTAPPLPPGREIDLPGRGTTFIRELPGPPAAATVVLLHGWTVTADLNFFACYEALSRRFRVITLDHRGHGRGIRADEPFTLEACADDAAALCDVLGIELCIPVGYSMGGPVAQLMWQRHRDLVQGLVLCATAAKFKDTREEQLHFLSLNGLASLMRLTPGGAQRWLTEQFLQRKGRSYEAWALEELARHDLASVVEAGAAIGRFSSVDWLGELDVPVSIVVTMADKVVPMRRQLRLFEAIPTAQAYRVDGEHDAVVSRTSNFVPTLVAACSSVVERSRNWPAVDRRQVG